MIFGTVSQILPVKYTIPCIHPTSKRMPHAQKSNYDNYKIALRKQAFCKSICARVYSEKHAVKLSPQTLTTS